MVSKDAIGAAQNELRVILFDGVFGIFGACCPDENLQAAGLCKFDKVTAPDQLRIEADAIENLGALCVQGRVAPSVDQINEVANRPTNALQLLKHFEFK